uniref:Putative secreted peptide n=1 Tax=Anopheles braziliensis TaxID=58242 RepID=A0A2M3ZQ75_9DIPT
MRIFHILRFFLLVITVVVLIRGLTLHRWGWHGWRVLESGYGGLMSLINLSTLSLLPPRGLLANVLRAFGS